MITQPPAEQSRNPGKPPGYWLLKRLRRGLRKKLSWLLARLLGSQTPTEPQPPIQPQQLQRVLIARINSRLGNMLFLTPLVRSIAATAPHCEIDLVVEDPAHAELFRTLPGVAQVHLVPAVDWRILVTLPRFISALRRRQYDLAIDPSLTSMGNRLLSGLSRSRWRLGYASYQQWLPLTHPVPPADESWQHETRKPLYPWHAAVEPSALRLVQQMSIGLTAEESARGRAGLTQALADAGVEGSGPVVGFFTEATGLKRLPEDWWRAWVTELRRLRSDVRLVQVLPPGVNQPLVADTATICRAAHRELAAVLAQLNLFVSADAGPMHLASAGGARVAGLFVSSRIDFYAPIGPGDLTVEVKDRTPESVAVAVAAHLDSLVVASVAGA